MLTDQSSILAIGFIIGVSASAMFQLWSAYKGDVLLAKSIDELRADAHRRDLLIATDVGRLKGRIDTLEKERAARWN